MVPRFDFNWGGAGYATYEVFLKVSGAERTAQAQTAQESQYLMNMMQTQFGEQQNLLNNMLIPQLQQMATNPQGFGAQQMAAMRAQTIGTIGTQLAEQQKGLAQQFSLANMAGVGSGVQAALLARGAQTAAGMEASSLQDLAIANAQMQQQQRMAGLSGLASASQLLGQAPQSAGLALSGSGQQFNQAYTMAKQGGFWSNMLQGVVGGLASGLTGGLGNIFGNLFTKSAPTATQVSAASDLGAAQASQYPSLTAGIQGPLAGDSIGAL